MGRRQHDEPTVDEIDDKYSEADPDDIVEDGIDYFRGKPETESEKQADDRLNPDEAGS